jgi:hypothetical protein
VIQEGDGALAPGSSWKNLSEDVLPRRGLRKANADAEGNGFVYRRRLVFGIEDCVQIGHES